MKAIDPIKITLFTIFFFSCQVLLAQVQKDLKLYEDNLSIVSTKKIWDKAPHSAFTDLLRYEDYWYCTFREANVHQSFTDLGTIRIIRSADGEVWESVDSISLAGYDLRDPHLSITPKNRLMVNYGAMKFDTSYGLEPLVSLSYASFSKNGNKWGRPIKLNLPDNEWAWTIVWRNDTAYTATYRLGQKPKLFYSEDGINYTFIAEFGLGPRFSEISLSFLNNGQMVALARISEPGEKAHYGVSSYPFTKWDFKPLNYKFGGPELLVLDDDKVIAAGRLNVGVHKTAVGVIKDNSFNSIIFLPSDGDNSYTGMQIADNDQIWMSYYSSHEGKTSIYLAKIQLKRIETVVTK